MLRLLWIVLFTIAFLASCVGWGALLRATLFRSGSGGWGELGAWGVSFLIVLGGFLNLLGLVWPTVASVLLAGGAVLCVALRQQLRGYEGSRVRPLLEPRRTVSSRVLLCLIVVLIAIHTVGSLAGNTFNAVDDLQAYFVFPTKIIQTGSLGADPFSGRRSLTSLGGKYFLDSLALPFLSHESLDLMDRGIGLLLLLGAFNTFLREQSLSTSGRAVPLLVIAAVPFPRANITALYLSSVLLVGMFRRLNCLSFSGGWRADAVLLALLTAGACALKSTMIPVCAVLLAAHYGQALLTVAPRAVLRSALVVLTATLAFSLPWMLAMYESAGTFLYPVFGRGHCGLPEVSGVSPAEALEIVALGVFFLAVMAAFVWCTHAWRLWPAHVEAAGISLFTSASLGSVFLGIGSAGMGFHRQAFPISFVASITALVFALLCCERGSSRFARRAGAAVSAGIIFALAAGCACRKLYGEAIHNAGFAASGQSLDGETGRRAVAALQSVVPAGAVLFAYLARPYLLDFKRNRVLIADWPGCCSPPPGMPMFQGPEALRAYLVGKSIRYVVFTGYVSVGKGPPSPNVWLVAARRYRLDFEENMTKLVATSHRIYEGEAGVVLDLETRLPGSGGSAP